MESTRISTIATALLLFVSISTASAQELWLTRTGFVSFYSHTKVEDIKAENMQVSSVLNMETGALKFVAQMRSFEFMNRTMQEHFNDNYVESEKYPKAEFTGEVLDIESLDFSTKKEHEVTVKGTMIIHGITQAVVVKGTLRKNDDAVVAEAKFPITLADYGIDITAASNKIAEEVEVTCSFNYKPR